MSDTATIPSRDTDPRVRRTRKMLQDALAKLLQEKDFEKISIGEIAEASTLNRATFYAHYADKFALLDCLVAAQFQRVIEERQIRFDGCDTALTHIAMGVCYYLAETVRPGAQVLPLETAIVGVVRRLLEEGFADHPLRAGVPAGVVASALAWAIYGAAREWVTQTPREPVEAMAETIGTLLRPVMRELAG